MASTASPSFLSLQQRQQRYDRLRLSLLACVLIVVTVLALSAGDQWVALWHWQEKSNQLLIWQLRLPRTLAVIAVGAALAVSGCVMQALFDNPLAEPGLLGISNGAGVTLMLLIVLTHGSISTLMLGGVAMGGALLVTSLLLLVSLRRHVTNAQLLLVGIALSMISGALMTWTVYFSTSIDLRQLLYWLMGGFGGVSWQQSGLILLLLPAIAWVGLQGRILNILAL
ncbi:MAG: iron chelate uptake ABC transporter family permease subunit, partial [Enterobacteriaceae bacterium]